MAEYLKFDENSIRAGGAVTDDVANDVEPLLVDVVSGDLLIEIAAGGGTATTDSVAQRDQNQRTVIMGVTDAGDLREIACDSNGYILIDAA
ncbi:MAG: hypothetical protein WC767_01070 [Candidatus Paceibacterota bacterium]|jgi:hypothetical protein